MKKFTYGLIFMLTLCLCSAAHAAFEMTVGRTSVTEGETFQIYLRQDKDTNSIDIAPLFTDFNVIGRRQTSQMRFVNGKGSHTYELILTLAPKKTGTLVIPALTSGNESTKPVEIKVLSADEALAGLQAQPTAATQSAHGQAAQNTASKAFLRASVSTENPMEKTPVVYTVRLFSSTDVMQGNIVPPSSPEFSLKQIDGPVDSAETVGGVPYRVTEYNFALTPQRTGKISVPAAVFSGTVVADDMPDLMNDNIDDMFDFNAFMRRPKLSSFLTGQALSVFSPVLTLNVAARPAQAGKDFLPASKVILSEKFSPDAPTVAQGDAVTRTVTLTAVGTVDSELPEIAFPDGADYKQYPSKSESKTVFRNALPVAEKTRQIVFIASKAGRVVLPALTVPWYDTVSKTMKTAVLPEKILTVTSTDASVSPENKSVSDAAEFGLSGMPETETQNAEKIPFAQEKTDVSPVADTVQPVSVFAGENTAVALKMFLAGLFLGAAVILVVWFIYKMRVKTKADGEVRETSSAFRQIVSDLKTACTENDPRKARDALKALAVFYWRDGKTVSLTEIAERLENPVFSDEIAVLNETLYGHDSKTWDGRALYEAFEDVKSKIKNRPPQEQSVVPPLYPL